MTIRFIDLRAMHLDIEDELRSAVDVVFELCEFAGGASVDAFEANFAKYCGTEHCVAVSSGTSALEKIGRAHV